MPGRHIIALIEPVMWLSEVSFSFLPRGLGSSKPFLCIRAKYKHGFNLSVIVQTKYMYLHVNSSAIGHTSGHVMSFDEIIAAYFHPSHPDNKNYQ